MKDLTSHSFMEAPAATLAALRRAGPVALQKIPLIGDVYVTTQQRSAEMVLKNSEIFTQRNLSGELTGLQWWMPKSIKLLGNNMLGADGAHHARLRGAVDDAFARRGILALQEAIEEQAVQTLKPFIAKGGGDFAREVARPFPLRVIADLLGLPREDHPMFLAWGEQIAGPTNVFAMFALMPAVTKMADYLRERIRHSKPDDPGLIAGLWHGEAHQLTEDEIVSMVFLLLVAGFETTTHLISGGVLAFGQNPDQRALYVENASTHPLAVEEALRFVSPVMMTNARTAQRDFVIDDVIIKRGEKIMALLVGANYDPAIFQNPEMFDITRTANRHMSFATGVHFCLGHQLARLEANALFEALFRLAVDWQLNSDRPEYFTRIGLRALKSLPIYCP